MLAELLAQPGHAFGSRVGHVRLDEERVAQGHFEVVEPVADQRLKGNGIDIVRLNALEDLGVEVDRLFLGKPQQDTAKTDVLITADQLEMELTESEATAELGLGWASAPPPCDRSRWPPPSCAGARGRAPAPCMDSGSSADARLDGREATSRREDRVRRVAQVAGPVVHASMARNNQAEEDENQATHGSTSSRCGRVRRCSCLRSSRGAVSKQDGELMAGQSAFRSSSWKRKPLRSDSRPRHRSVVAVR